MPIPPPAPRPRPRPSPSISRPPILAAAAAFALALAPIPVARADDPPASATNPHPDSVASADNAVTRLRARVRAASANANADPDAPPPLVFERDRGLGYLRSLLEALDVPVSSQVLVFSKTSLQRDRIGPRTPRAIYFNDDVYVGYCRDGEVLEISAADPILGTAFYTLDQEPGPRPRLVRQTDACLVCHGSSATRGHPGHLVRSVFPDPRGEPILAAGSHRTDHASPLDERWGGWYVTGSHGTTQRHMGNWTIARDRDREREPLRRAARTAGVHDSDSDPDGDDPDDRPPAALSADDNLRGQNRDDLREFFTVSAYLSPHSDIVALMVLEYQAALHNRIAAATLETRAALEYQRGINEALGEPPGTLFESTRRRIDSVCEQLVRALLLVGEAPLVEPVAGTSEFAREFQARGPRDPAGRSLRDLDLRTRLFRYPCGYLVHSEAFDRMPEEARRGTLDRLLKVLKGENQHPDYARLSPDDRTAILEILRATKPDLPPEWRE